jgi:hypothetical protein
VWFITQFFSPQGNSRWQTEQEASLIMVNIIINAEKSGFLTDKFSLQQYFSDLFENQSADNHINP